MRRCAVELLFINIPRTPTTDLDNCSGITEAVLVRPRDHLRRANGFRIPCVIQCPYKDVSVSARLTSILPFDACCCVLAFLFCSS